MSVMIKQSKQASEYVNESDENGHVCGVSYHGDPDHEFSLKIIHGENTVSVIFANNPEHPRSFVEHYDGDGKLISVIQGRNPRHQLSYREGFDEVGNSIWTLWADDPAHEYSCGLDQPNAATSHVSEQGDDSEND